MSIRLYDSAWVTVDGEAHPVRVLKDRRQPGYFQVGDFVYDIDGRPARNNAQTPRILAVLSLQAAKDAGVRADYNGGPDFGIDGYV